jgi:lysophospholipase L1-like esterase
VLLLLSAVALFGATAGTGGRAWAAALTLGGLLTVVSGVKLARVRPARLAGILVFVVLNLAVLAAFDLVVRAVVLPKKSQNSLYIAHDPFLGWKLRPGFSVTRRTEHYTSTETINSAGFRTPEVPFAKPEGVKRILVLGDSHSEGYTVNDDETWPVRLQHHLAAHLRAEVVSLGIGGWSTDQELLSYIHHGRLYAPDLVLLQTAANDFEFNVLDRYWRGLKPRFRRSGGLLLLEGVPVPDLRNVGFARHPFLRNSAIAMVLDASLSRFAVVRETEEADPREARRVTALLVRDLAGLSRADGARLAMFHATPDDTEADREFRRIAAEQDIPFLDILPAFGGDLGRHRVTRDKHWNREGHEAVARHLAALLLDLLR